MTKVPKPQRVDPERSTDSCQCAYSPTSPNDYKVNGEAVDVDDGDVDGLHLLEDHRR